MEFSPTLIINRMILKGISGNYEATFREGLNIVWGDMDSGKSSILNIIDYCLGGSNKKLLYEEMTSKARRAFIELSINENTFTIERDILEPKSAIKVYTGEFESIQDLFPRFMAPTSNGNMPDGWISDFLLESLGIARVKIKESSIRSDADEDRLSFRDLMKLMYLKQTLVGSDSLCDAGNPALFSKNVAIQKFVYNIHDERLATLRSELTEESKGLTELKSSEASISNFLRDVKITTENFSASDQIDIKKNHLLELEQSTIKLKNDFVLNSGVSAEIRKRVAGLKNELDSTVFEVHSIERKISDYSKLKSTYILDLENLKLSQIARPHLATKESLKKISCPLCNSDIPIHSEALTESDIDNAKKSLANRLSGVESAISQLWEKHADIKKSQLEIQTLISQNSRIFDEQNASNISPLLISIEAIEKTKLDVSIELAELKRNLSIHHKHGEIKQKIGNKLTIIEGLKRNIASVEAGLTGLDEILRDLTALLKNHLEDSGLQNVNRISLNKNFILHFRGMSYYDISSGGVKTITSIAIYLTRLAYILKNACNLPSFLIIDTPGQNIGRYKRDDDDIEVSDPALYENIYAQIMSITTTAKSKGRRCQIIVVDNDFPDILKEQGEESDFHLVKRFRKKGGEFEKGLINDA
ncbi:hypothetical protein [Pseudomonas chlororaphis]|uniref:AAA family ATPase n=1 Tax=Pseudomonas chlororaphis TaxID=587753 RepID=UPI0037CBC3A3